MNFDYYRNVISTLWRVSWSSSYVSCPSVFSPRLPTTGSSRPTPYRTRSSGRTLTRAFSGALGNGDIAGKKIRETELWEIAENPRNRIMRISRKSAKQNYENCWILFSSPAYVCTREYWLIYRGPDFLAVIWFGDLVRIGTINYTSSPTPSPLSRH